MTRPRSFDALLASVLDELGAPGPSDYLDDVFWVTRRTRQRSAARWFSVDLAMPRLVTPRGAGYPALLAVLLIASLVVAMLIAGSHQRRLPAPFGPAATGSFVFETRGDLYLADRDGHVNRILTAWGKQEFGASFSRDGTRLAYWTHGVPAAFDGGGLWVADADGRHGRLIHRTTTWKATPAAQSVAHSWSPDGRRLAFATGAGDLYVIEADGERAARRIGDHSMTRFDPAWSPDGTLIAYYGQGSRPGVYVIEPDGDAERLVSQDSIARRMYRVGASGLDHRAPSWSPDGHTLIYHVNDDIVVARRDGGTWSETIIVAGETADSWPQFSNDGSRIAFVRVGRSSGWPLERPRRLLIVADVSGANERQLESPPIAWAPPCWTPDDGSITAVTGVNSDDEAAPGYVVFAVDGSRQPVFIPAPIRSTLATCSWQRLPLD